MARQLVHNLTDVSTPALRQSGLVSTHIRVGDVTLPPGGSEFFYVTPAFLSDTAVHRSVGALCVGDPPKKYLVKKELQAAAKPAEVAFAPEPVEAVQASESLLEKPAAEEESEHKSSRRSRRKVDGE